jgi:hypothetical protein
MWAAMGRWIFVIACILLFVAGGYWFLQHTGVDKCNEIGGVWDYARWTCNTD